MLNARYRDGTRGEVFRESEDTRAEAASENFRIIRNFTRFLLLEAFLLPPLILTLLPSFLTSLYPSRPVSVSGVHP